jgi:hypothetical protein
MNDELRSESQAEIWRGGKIRKNPFLCPAYFSAILLLSCKPWSAVKATQTGTNQSRTLRRRLVRRSLCGEGGSGSGCQNAIIAMDSGAKQVRKIREFSLFPDFGLLAIFPLEPAAVQSIATETDRGNSRISREILRGWCMGGRGARKSQMLKL